MSKPAAPVDPKLTQAPPDCFVIMPFREYDGYPAGHFRRVYDDIIAPACRLAGFTPIRDDQIAATNLIQLDLLQRLLNSPMAICDLSQANPNVMFELALRQAFDKPVALIQEVGSRPIFDISGFRCKEYRKERLYHEVLADQQGIAGVIRATFDGTDGSGGVNSIVKLLALSHPATLPKPTHAEKQEDLQRVLLSEVAALRREVRNGRLTEAPKETGQSERLALALATMKQLLLDLQYHSLAYQGTNNSDEKASIHAEIQQTYAEFKRAQAQAERYAANYEQWQAGNRLCMEAAALFPPGFVAPTP